MTWIYLLIYATFVLVMAALQKNEHIILIKDRRMSRMTKAIWAGGRVLIVCLLSAAYFLLGLCSIGGAIALAIAGLAYFSFIFRKSLNEEMGWNKNYMGSTSRYDVLWIQIAELISEGYATPTIDLQEDHDIDYATMSTYRDTVHLAGKLANVGELLVVVAGVLVYL